MNKQIQKLAQQAREYACERDEDLFEEKFAELIVKECSKIMRDKDYSHTADPIFEASCDIQEHFGVA